MFLDILNRRAASGVNTAHSRQELQRELPKLDNLFSQDTDAERPADRFGARFHLGNAQQGEKADAVLQSRNHDPCVLMGWNKLEVAELSCREFVRSARMIDEQATEYQTARLRPGNGRTRAIGSFGR
jgi:hypothetical protein